MRPEPDVAVLYEDNHCLVVDKPAGLLAQGDATGDPSLVDWAAAYLRAKYDKPGNVYIGLIHRLDRPVSGLMVLARTSKAAERLSRQFHTGTVTKVYRAIVEGTWSEPSGIWRDRLLKDHGENRTRALSATDEDTTAGREAVVAYRVLGETRTSTLFELRPQTGRSHQLRVQLAARGLPILGDTKYGGRWRLPAADGGHRIALHACALQFQHPTRPEVIEITASLPSDWPAPASLK